MLDKFARRLSSGGPARRGRWRGRFGFNHVKLVVNPDDSHNSFGRFDANLSMVETHHLTGKDDDAPHHIRRDEPSRGPMSPQMLCELLKKFVVGRGRAHGVTSFGVVEPVALTRCAPLQSSYHLWGRMALLLLRDFCGCKQ
jgi:hypothetical protein